MEDARDMAIAIPSARAGIVSTTQASPLSSSLGSYGSSASGDDDLGYSSPDDIDIDPSTEIGLDATQHSTGMTLFSPMKPPSSSVTRSPTTPHRSKLADVPIGPRMWTRKTPRSSSPDAFELKQMRSMPALNMGRVAVAEADEEGEGIAVWLLQLKLLQTILMRLMALTF